MFQRPKYQRRPPRTAAEIEERRGRHFAVGKGELPPEEQRIDWNDEFEKKKRRLKKVSDLSRVFIYE